MKTRVSLGSEPTVDPPPDATPLVVEEFPTQALGLLRLDLFAADERFGFEPLVVVSPPVEDVLADDVDFLFAIVEV